MTLCKGPAYMGIKGNEETDRAAKEAIDCQECPQQDYPIHTIRRVRNFE